MRAPGMRGLFALAGLGSGLHRDAAAMDDLSIKTAVLLRRGFRQPGVYVEREANSDRLLFGLRLCRFRHWRRKDGRGTHGPLYSGRLRNIAAKWWLRFITISGMIEMGDSNA